ncbi:hypothetical protein E2C01_043224 [Portunus trituberculatus]|uniref:Uncharacterized protein n=1 Tax=Portunus trituberculatus TaxID=210409 RepID=A0A5B7FVR2_PORTR|nr:hypothetical protein [Portunus trituberculatus]
MKRSGTLFHRPHNRQSVTASQWQCHPTVGVLAVAASRQKVPQVSSCCAARHGVASCHSLLSFKNDFHMKQMHLWILLSTAVELIL